MGFIYILDFLLASRQSDMVHKKVHFAAVSTKDHDLAEMDLCAGTANVYGVSRTSTKMFLILMLFFYLFFIFS